MLIAEDLLLLLTDDRSGKATVAAQRLAFALAGGVLVELLLLGRLTITQEGSRARVALTGAAPVGDPMLDGALQRIAGKRQPVLAQTVVTTLARDLPDAVRARLVARGILREEHGRVLGVFPTHAWPAADSTHEEAVRRALWDVIVVGRTPSDREVCLVALLQAVDQVPKQFAVEGMSARQLRERAKAMSAGNVGGDAVRRAVQATEAAVAASMAASAAVMASSS